MSAKDNFAQAMKELLNNSDSNTSVDENTTPVDDLTSFVQSEVDVAFDEETDLFAEVAVEETVEFSETAPADYQENLHVEDNYVAMEVSQIDEMNNMGVPSPEGIVTDEVTVIATGTVIIGDLSVGGGLCVNGEIKGNLKVAGMVELNGKVIGDIVASDAVIVNSRVRGNLTVGNMLSMDGNSVVAGDVVARNIDINGKIKGNLTVEERGHFQQDAVLLGNLISGTVIIDEGAMLKGDISIANMQPESIEVDESEFDID